MIAKPPQKEAEILFRCIIEQKNKLKEFAKKQLAKEIKKEMQKMHDEWFKTFLSQIEKL
jgi:hypothetical protein